MPFANKMRPYTKESILALSANQSGVYGIFHDTVAIYIGSGDLRDRLLDHISGDNACITANTPNLWTGEVLPSEPTGREGELIREYRPKCNRVIP
jgi:hypothetical protein